MRNITFLMLALALTACARTHALKSVSFPNKDKATDYQIVYDDRNITIWEKFLGWENAIDWDNFIMPERRIPYSYEGTDEIMDIYDECYRQLSLADHCSYTIGISGTDGTTDEYILTWERYIVAGVTEITRNGKTLWRGYMNGGTGTSIAAIKIFDNQIAVEYVDVDNIGQFGVLYSVLHIQGDRVTDFVNDEGYTLAFAPNELKDKLAFFAKRGEELFFVFDGQDIKLNYDKVFNQLCCWSGPRIQVSSNGEIVDFFAKRDNGWYHVQVMGKDLFESR